MRIIFLLTLLLAASLGQSQTISTLDFVEVKNGNTEEALYYYENNWKVLREMAIQQNYILSYQLIQVPPSDESNFELILLTTYTDQEQYDARSKHFDELIEKKGPLRLMNEKQPGEFRGILFNHASANHIASYPPMDENPYIASFKQYFHTLSHSPENKWNYTADTVKVWFDDKEGTPSLRIKGKPSTGKWKAWDQEMHASSSFSSLWYDAQEHSIKGYFFEENDFYTLIDKGPTKTLRTYWLNDENLIDEILIYWLPKENTTTSEHLKPIVQWALKYSPEEIKQIYPNNRIVPSKENAIKWKQLLQRYHEAQE